MKKVIVIGAGFGGMASASILAKNGYDVTIIEKNDQPGGRCRKWEKSGFMFDMGPSWYLMNEVFEDYFSIFNKKSEDFYRLKRLNPNYRLFFSRDYIVDIPAELEGIYEIFDNIEKKGSEKLKRFLSVSSYQYDIAMKQLMYREYDSIKDVMDMNLISKGLGLHLFENIDKFVRRYFEEEKLRKIIEYTMVFLGGSPHNTPALYSIMSHVDFDLGVYYPEGGMIKVTEAFKKIADESGVRFIFNTPAKKINVKNGRAVSVTTASGETECDIVISNADYRFTEMELLDTESRTYNKKDWEKRVIGPSAMLMYLGVNGKVQNLQHHNLFLAGEWDRHFKEIFDDPQWPLEPSYYISSPSKTDSSVAPDGKENIFVLVPVAPGLNDLDEIREEYAKRIMSHIEGIIGQKISGNLEVKRIFTHKDFISDYNAYKGTALGMSHTLMQTALFRCSMKSRKADNIYYAGSYTHPGIGLPMVTIAGQIVSKKIMRENDR